jgi:hypothetical protein
MSPGSREDFLVSILGQQSMNPVGVGFVVGERHVVTCAHVINTALGRDKQAQGPPGDNVRVLIEFPLLDSGEGAPARRARVSAWSPPPSGSAAVGGDVAGLVIVGEPLPAGASPARLLAAGEVTPGTQVAFFGYPGDPPRKKDGAWATTRWRGRVGGGVIQIDADPGSAVRTQPGYSGSPAVIRDGQGDAVAGILQSASPDATMRDARIVPAASLAEAWPAVLGDVLVPDCPYPGLSAFGKHDAEKGYFVGREDEVRALLGVLEAEPMAAVVGPSGVGKSSLVGAGLIPEYEQRGWRTLMFRPGADPFSALARALLRGQQDEQAVSRDDRRRLSEELRHRDLAEIAGEIAADTDQGLLIVIDQLEEMLAAGCAEERPLFIERAFPGAAARPGNWRLVVTLRADFYPALLAHAEAAPRLHRRELPLSPIGVNQMIRAIEEPAARVGVTYAKGLAEQIARDAGQGGGGLPLLEFTLAAIWPNQRGRVIGLAEYLSSGGVTGALNRHADEWLARHGAADADRVRRVLLKLVRSRGGASAATRRTAPRTDFTEQDWGLIQELAVQRLVVLDQDREGTETAELAHEALVRSWSRLARWADEDADFQRWLATVEERAAQDEVISENRLEEATRWVAERRDDVPDHIRQFVAESQRRRDESAAREHQRQLAIRVSESLRLAMQARESIPAEPETALLLLPGNSDESPVRQGEFPETVVTALRDQVFAGHEVVMSPDASRVIIQGELWSLAGEHIARLIGPNDSLVATTETKILGAGFQPGGEKIVTAAGNGMVWFWAADGTLAGSVVADSGSPDAVFGIAIDPLGKYVAVGVREKTSLWSWDGEERYRLPTAGYKVKRLCFAPDGSRLITVATPWPESPKDAWVELWPRSNQKIVVDIDDDTWPAFDPSSRYFFLHDAAAVRIFDLDGEPLGTLAGPFRTGVTGITASADGDFVAASFTDGVARIWSLAAGRRLTALRIGQATGIVFSPDNQRLLAASPDGQIRQHAVSIQELIPAAAHRLDRVLTRDERTRFSIQDPVRLDLNALRRMRHEDG